jgi:hypothetical protein
MLGQLPYSTWKCRWFDDKFSVKKRKLLAENSRGIYKTTGKLKAKHIDSQR